MYPENRVQFLPEISLRWLTIACFEIRVGDFHIVIDPCIGLSKQAGFGAEVIEKADLILLSHGHWDHTSDLKELLDKFDCPLLCGELTAPPLIRMLDCNPTKVYPMTPNLELDFGAVRVKALFGRHTNQRCPLSSLEASSRTREWNDTPEKLECGFYGHLEYRNYLITTPSGTKILFWGNNETPEQTAILRAEQPDVALMQFTKQKPDELARLAAAGNVKILIPHHMDLSHGPDEYIPRIDALEAEFAASVPRCAVVHPEHLKWYDIGFGIRASE